jgi:hypothetical protein
MQALSDDQQMERLEKKVDDGFAAVRDEFKEVRSEFKEFRSEVRSEIQDVRSEARADHRTLLGVQLTTIVAMVLGFAGIILQHHL